MTAVALILLPYPVSLMRMLLWPLLLVLLLPPLLLLLQVRLASRLIRAVRRGPAVRWPEALRTELRIAKCWMLLRLPKP